MFCPKCGKADQAPETFCRQCGIYLPDLSKPLKTGAAPEVHVLANIVLGSMTIAACFTLAALLYVILGFKPDTHPLIYVTAGLLIAMGCWHIQTVWRTVLLRRHLKKTKPPRNEVSDEAPQQKALKTANLDDFVPASVTDRTTARLSNKKPDW